MEFYGRSPTMEGSPTDPALQWNPQPVETGLEEPMWQLTIGGESSRESYPERPGEQDCTFYMRTGFCGYGASCRFNHPRDRNLQVAVLRSGEYPERVGEPVCQYFMKTGTCKFGAACKYHHPRHGPMNTGQLNSVGYPLRPGEKECSYYMKTGLCKFGVTCKFHHPQPAASSLSSPVSAFYPTVQSPSSPSPHTYGTGVTSWHVARPPVLPGSYVQGPYSPVLLHPGVVQLPSWGSYPPTVAPLASPAAQHPAATGSPYGVSHQLSPSAPAYQGPFSSLSSLAGPSSSTRKENTFPVRLGQPECQFYMKTGDCKFGASCKYHHPPDRVVLKSSCVLSPVGLPLRPGAPTCTFYAQHGVCKFGRTCKFDHPMGSMSYSPSASSLADMPVAPYPVGSSMATLAPSSSSSDLRLESIAELSKDSSAAREGYRVSSSETTSSGSISSIFSKGGQAAATSSQSTAPPSSSTDHVGKFHS
ncbi:unnamed protein product [Victoria cruziana]